MSTEHVKDVVREKYSQAALRARAGAGEFVLRRRFGHRRVLRSHHVELMTTPPRRARFLSSP